MTYAKSALLNTLTSKNKARRHGGASKQISLSSLWKEKSGFMLQVFSLLIIQLGITFLVMYQLSALPQFTQLVDKYELAFFLATFIGLLLLIIILAFVPMPIYLKLIIFTLFSSILGMVFAITKRFVSEDLVKVALIGTIAVFVVMFSFGLITRLIGWDLGWLSGFLLTALLIVLLWGIVLMFMDASKTMQRIKAVVVILLFSIFIIYDTNQILQRNYMGDFVTAALDYFLDVINIFVNILASGDS
jgi:FtsH-binding integral membrane protein